MPQSIKELLANNRQWAEKIRKDDPEFFTNLSHQQSPKYLWIGCSDSRVPANQITGLAPGEVFVHRNVANQVIHTDLNCLSVIQFAVDVLKIEHIIVCGHYGCGGVKAALQKMELGLIDNWLRHIQDIAETYQSKLKTMKDENKKWDALAEFNVMEQVYNVGQTTVVQNAWKQNQTLTVHGWIYGLTDGLIRDLEISISSIEDALRKSVTLSKKST